MINNLDKIKQLCKSLDFKGNTSDEFLFTINCVDYFYFSKNIGEVDILDGFTDGSNDGGIDFVYYDGYHINLIQGKSTNNLTFNDISAALSKMVITINDFKENNIDKYSDLLKSNLRNIMETADTDEMELTIFTNTDITNDMIKKIENLKNNAEFESYTINVYGKDDIDTQVLNIDEASMSIEQGSLTLENKNFIEYADGKGAIFTIKANSLKNLYIDYGKKGLFGYNLREQIAQKSVDSAIDKTINSDRENFWFYNNGITIGCKDYVPDGNTVKLYDFSIINGAQTTTKIGKSSIIDKDHDFCLVCKVIKSSDDAFMREISKASNSQKPIKDRDLKANAIEQRTLQQKFISNGKYQLAVEIKRGVKPKNSKNVESWQKVTNEYIGQILLAAQYQMPGTARSAKADIFSKDTTYIKLFSKDKIKNYDYNTIYDLVRVAAKYDKFKIRYKEENEEKASQTKNENEKKNYNALNGVCNNAKFVVISIIAYYIKRLYFDLKNADDDNFDKPIIKGNMSLDYKEDDYDEKLRYLFEFIIDRLSFLYDKNEVSLGLTSYSNFFKTDNVYKKDILPDFESCLHNKFLKDQILNNIDIFK